MISIKTCETIEKFRKKYNKNDNQELQSKRERFLDWLNCQTIEMPKIFEMYPAKNTIYGRKQIAQYIWEYHFANTRTQISTETRAEIDKVPLNEAINIICQICLSLINKNFHFAVFYAEGQRSPHIIIYDFKELKELSNFQRVKVQAKFWRWVAPFYFHFLDHSIWDNTHYVPLEFSIHWKYGTPFNLLFEWVPENEGKNAKDTI